MGGERGRPVFSVSISGDSDKYEGIELSGFLRLFKDGAFNRGAQVRMKTLTDSSGSGGAPERGIISAHFRKLVANLDGPEPSGVALNTRDDVDRTKHALDDLTSSSDAGFGDRALTVRQEYLRDPKIRQRVIDFSNGKCEYCQKPGFMKLNGERYLEAHHVISLANNGDDSVDNLIALCPEHHREAHFGANGEALERDFMKVITRRRAKP
jgi:hypothetical protein